MTVSSVVVVVVVEVARGWFCLLFLVVSGIINRFVVVVVVGRRVPRVRSSIGIGLAFTCSRVCVFGAGVGDEQSLL